MNWSIVQNVPYTEYAESVSLYVCMIFETNVPEKWGCCLQVTPSAEATCRELAVRVSTYAQVLKNCVFCEPRQIYAFLFVIKFFKHLNTRL